MKKILIFSHAMEIGGAEKALLGLLESFDTSKYKVDLFLMRHSGELMRYIPKNINLLPENEKYASLAVPILHVLKKKQFNVAYARLLGKNAAKRRMKNLNLGTDNDVQLQYSHKYTLPVMPQISDTEYDLAISFLTPHYFVTEKVNAKKKIAWIHTDYSTIDIDTKTQFEMWNKYDAIASISEDVTKSFLQVMPELEQKVQLIANIMPIKYMKELAEEFEVIEEIPLDNSIKLLSIGRFCTAKNFDNIPAICKKLIKVGLNIKWYIIGYGGEEQLIRQKINEAGMEKNVLILGKKENPYPYIKACDLYVQPSRYEGKCVSVIEAQMFHKPVVITEYTTAQSQLEDGVDGIIVPMDNEGCALGIAKILKNELLREVLIKNTKSIDYSNKQEIQKLYALIGE